MEKILLLRPLIVPFRHSLLYIDETLYTRNGFARDDFIRVILEMIQISIPSSYLAPGYSRTTVYGIEHVCCMNIITWNSCLEHVENYWFILLEVFAKK